MSLIDLSSLLTIIAPLQPVHPSPRRPSVGLSPQPHGAWARGRGLRHRGGQPASRGRDR